ncbi:MAG: hypothetical protein CM1200mP23_2950 [Nitrososphaerota archaeon]|nr:MAG: hypothetical protein CM1200mP23_2950 [Nitrososphaerota archaeon]
MKKTYLDIIDPIHDFVRVNNSELEIIDTPIFQRLRRIKQLSGAHLIYPGLSILDLNTLLVLCILHLWHVNHFLKNQLFH